MIDQNSQIPTLDEIAENYGSLVSGLCRRMIRNRELAEDAAQEIWYEVVKSLGSFKGRSSVSTWLYTIARRTLNRHIQKEKNYSTRFLNEYFELYADDGSSQMQQIADEDRMQWMKLECDACLTGILHCLDNESRLTYLLRTLTELSYKELADILDQTDEAIRQRFSRASRKLNSFLNNHCTLYNPKGKCRCKMDKPIRYIDHKKEYEKIRDFSKKLLFIKNANEYHGVENEWVKLTIR